MGQGRHSMVLARVGFRVFGVDIRPDSVFAAVSNARAAGLQIYAWCADLISHPLPRARFDLVVVTRYLQRDLFVGIRNAVVPGGFVLYETFTVAQRSIGTGPQSSDHLLEPGELRRRFDGFEIVFYEEVDGPAEAVARLVAKKPAT